MFLPQCRSVVKVCERSRVPFSVEGTRTPLTPEKVSVLQRVLTMRVNFKKNVWSVTKKTVRNNECPY